MGNDFIDKQAVIKICEAYNIGEQLLSPQLIPNQSLHKLYKLETTQGIFALKEFDSIILALANQDEESLNETQKIANTLSQQINNIVPAIFCKNNFTIKLQNKIYMLFHWQEGQHYFPPDISDNKVQEIGKLLAKIHSAHLIENNLPKINYYGFPDYHWRHLFEKIEQNNSPAIFALNSYLGKLIHWSHLADYAKDKINNDLVISHCDLDAKNVLWRDNCAWLIDWDYAGYINPFVELIAVALNWSGILSKQFNMDYVKELLLGYSLILRRDITFTVNHIYGYFGYVLAWVEWEMRYMLAVPDQQHKIINEIFISIDVLNWLERHMSYFTKTI